MPPDVTARGQIAGLLRRLRPPTSGRAARDPSPGGLPASAGSRATGEVAAPVLPLVGAVLGSPSILGLAGLLGLPNTRETFNIGGFVVIGLGVACCLAALRRHRTSALIGPAFCVLGAGVHILQVL